MSPNMPSFLNIFIEKVLDACAIQHKRPLRAGPPGDVLQNVQVVDLLPLGT